MARTFLYHVMCPSLGSIQNWIDFMDNSAKIRLRIMAISNERQLTGDPVSIDPRQHEARKHTRSSVWNEVRLQSLDEPITDIPPDRQYCAARDISEGGMRISANRAYPINAPVLISTSSKKFGWNMTSRVGVVIWAKSEPIGRTMLGIKFDDREGLDLFDECRSNRLNQTVGIG